MRSVRCACIDIGSNTTRLLVADVDRGAVVPVLHERVYTRIGRALGSDGVLAPDVVADVARVAGAQAQAAREHGAESIRTVGTAALRRAANAADLCAAVQAASGLEVEVLAEEDEARLAFAGALAAAGGGLEGTIAVVDVGGGSSELAIGTAQEGVTWWASLPVGSGSMAEACLRGDPPGPDELAALHEFARRAVQRLEPPAADRAIAVGGSAASLRALVGPVLDAGALANALAALCSGPSATVALEKGIAPERARLLPAGLHLLGAFGDRLGRPLEVGGGGLREGVVLALAARP